jgi:hypothetical protein
MPLLYFTGFARLLNEEDFEEHLTQGEAVEGITSITVAIVLLARLFSEPQVNKAWRIFIVCGLIVHVLAVLILARHTN